MKNKKSYKILPKLEITNLVVFILVLVIAGVAAMIGLSVQSNIANSLALCNTNYSFIATNDSCVQNNASQAGADLQHPINIEYNASENAQAGISNLTGQFPNIGLVIAAVVIIGLLVGGFAFAFQRGGGGGF